jgi:hypothetical protein
MTKENIDNLVSINTDIKEMLESFEKQKKENNERALLDISKFLMEKEEIFYSRLLKKSNKPKDIKSENPDELSIELINKIKTKEKISPKFKKLEIYKFLENISKFFMYKDFDRKQYSNVMYKISFIILNSNVGIQDEVRDLIRLFSIFTIIRDGDRFVELDPTIDIAKIKSKFESFFYI